MSDTREMPRLSDPDRYHAINDFVWDRLGTDCSDDDFDAFVQGCTVVYRDDLDTGRSWYQVTDAQGHGDGSGIWTEVL